MLAWALGAGAAVVALGPALGSGYLLGLDLVSTPDIPVPTGVWGLGPGFPRRVPLGLPLAWGSSLVGGDVAMKALLGACVAVAFVGAWRLAAPTPALCRLGAGLLYALGPFTLTRLGVGHWGVLAAVAVLPWALPHLLRPADDLRRTFLWSAALGVTGITGGMYGAVVLAVGLAAERGRRAGAVVGAFTLAQLPWVVPGVVVLATGPGRELADPSRFATRVEGLWGPLRLVVGQGFWRAGSQVGAAPGLGEVLLAGALVGTALLGAGALPRPWRNRAAVVAGAGFVAALASGMPGLDRLYRAVSATPLGAAGRESQRLLPLFLVWFAPAVAFGVVELAKWARRALEPTMWALPAAAAVALAWPGLWGVGGRLEPATFPAGWVEARSAVRAAPGTVVALPWHRYLDVGFAGGRRVFNPLEDYLGGDVVMSSDPELGEPSAEDPDPREAAVVGALDGVRAGRPQSGLLASLGVRWVVVLHEVDWRRYESLARDPGLERVVGTASLELFRVRRWRGLFVDEGGRPVGSDARAAPLLGLDASGPVTWAHPAARGWLRGTAAARTTPAGLLSLPAGRGPVWYWPAALTLVADAATGAGLVLVLSRRRRPALAPEAPARGAAPAPAPAPGLASRRELLALFLAEKRDPEPFYDRLAERSVAHLGYPLRGVLVLDLGCGPGHYSRALSRAGALVVPVDADLESLGAAPASGAGVADGTRLPFAAATFWGVICSNVLEHTPDAEAVVAEIERVLRPGGWAWVSWTNWYSPWGGHEIVPFQYLGPRLGLAVSRRLRGEPRKNVPFVGLWPTHVGRTLAMVRRRPGLHLVSAAPRYYPSQRWILAVPGLREVATWNCLLRLERAASRVEAGPAVLACVPPARISHEMDLLRAMPGVVLSVASHRDGWGAQRHLVLPARRVPVLGRPERWTAALAWLGGLGGLDPGRADVVVSFELFSPVSAQAARLARRTNGLHVVTVFENLADSPLYRLPPWRQLTRAVVRSVALVVCFTRSALDHAVALGCPPERCVVVHPGVDTALFRPAPGGRPPAPTVLFAGMLRADRGADKGVPALVSACEQLADEVDGLRLVLVGDGHLRAGLEEQAESRRFLEVVGSRPRQEVAALMRGARVVALASRRTAKWQEQLSFVLVEAMATGLPVVATRSGSIPEVVPAWNPLVAEGDVAGLVDGLRAALGPAGDGWGRRNRGHVLERFDLARQGGRLAEVLAGLTARH